ncbi:MAG: hypothetical protein C4294_04755 [Nitrospiraceae bacterium]
MHVLFSVMLALLAVMQGCAPEAKPGLPPGSPFAEATTAGFLTHGVATGDVTDHSASVWLRTDGPAKAWIEWMPGAGACPIGHYRDEQATGLHGDGGLREPDPGYGLRISCVRVRHGQASSSCPGRICRGSISNCSA